MPKSFFYKNLKGEEYDFDVQVYTRPNLRDGVGEMLMYMGRSILEQMFDKCEIDEKTEIIHLEYPERWANILELRAIPERIPVCFPNIKKVTIVTHSVYIIQCVHNTHINMCDNNLITQYPEEKYADLKTRYCPLPGHLEGLYSVSDKELKKL
jgi:hypothetical protein